MLTRIGSKLFMYVWFWNVLIFWHNKEGLYLNLDTFNLQAYDQHLNMIMGDVEETVTTVEIDEETYEEIYKVRKTFVS